MKLFFVICLIFIKRSSAQDNESTEALFRSTVGAWRASNGRNYKPWHSFSQSLLQEFEKTTRNRLELVGGMEEGILAIEKATIHEGENAERDAALAELYYAYGKSLSELTSDDCKQLALDPHTLLIGAETVTQASSPSTELCVENAENSLRNAVTLNANHVQAEEFLQKITGETTVHKRKPKEFVAELFDSFADSFDAKLASLEYKVPGMVGDMAKELLLSFSTSYQAALDAGCGTGLAGRYLRPLVSGPMVGVDASQKMLDIASKCTTTSGCGLDEETGSGGEPLYQGLLALDLEDMTLDNTLGAPGVVNANNAQGFDLIVAADVFVYFGQLDKILQTFASLATRHSKLVFSCERATNQEAPLGWRLLSSGRFAHTKQHAVEAAAKAGYKLVAYKEIVPRIEKGQDVRGHLFGFSLEESMSSSGGEL